MTALPRACDQWSEREAALADEVEDLREELRQLKALFTGSDWEPPKPLRLTKLEQRVLQLFMRRTEVVTYEQLMFAMYADRVCDEWPSSNSAAVFVWKVRAKLRALGLSIDNVWGRGWRMPDETRARLLQMAEASA